MKTTKALAIELTHRTRPQAIRAKCLECCCDNAAEVKECELKKCPLWIYRLGYEVDYDGNKLTQKEKSDRWKL